MDFLVSAMVEGGPFMWPLVALLPVGLLVSLVCGGATAARVRVPVAAWVMVPALVVLTGLLGTLQGYVLVAEAVAHAHPETRRALAHAGVSTAFVTVTAGLALAAVLCAIGALSSGLGSLAGRARPDAEDPALETARVAEGRLVLGTHLVATVAFGAMARHATGQIIQDEAVAHATSGTMAAMIEAGQAMASTALLVGGCLSVGAVVAAGALVAPVVGGLTGLRGGVALATAAVFLALGVVGYGGVGAWGQQITAPYAGAVEAERGR